MRGNSSGIAYDSLRFAELDAGSVLWGPKLGEGSQAVVFSGTLHGELIAIKQIKLRGFLTSSVSKALRVSSPRQGEDGDHRQQPSPQSSPLGSCSSLGDVACGGGVDTAGSTRTVPGGGGSQSQTFPGIASASNDGVTFTTATTASDGGGSPPAGGSDCGATKFGRGGLQLRPPPAATFTPPPPMILQPAPAAAVTGGGNRLMLVQAPPPANGAVGTGGLLELLESLEARSVRHGPCAAAARRPAPGMLTGMMLRQLPDEPCWYATPPLQQGRERLRSLLNVSIVDASHARSSFCRLFSSSGEPVA